ncbi:hypothetical protein BTIS_1095 [Bifidobacterium tissieri]|uniref:Uncharacterized protein n=1 Tax=Bifidobacterium tissieri TaxID=1630162 RepID=A0A261FFE5_9BIFI|nr:hypothetical protein [Bifidobacterium tissieri]OZG57854.1 hypothetical protein BTIS_1095 [Bifidobacterium tissieri]
MTLNELESLAEQCLAVAKGLDEDMEDDARDAIAAGEPEYAMASVLDMAYAHPELYAKLPPEVYELARNPDYVVLHRYQGLLEKHRQ